MRILSVYILISGFAWTAMSCAQFCPETVGRLVKGTPRAVAKEIVGHFFGPAAMLGNEFLRERRVWDVQIANEEGMRQAAKTGDHFEPAPVPFRSRKERLATLIERVPVFTWVSVD